jgi:hypothetical protein
MTWSFPRYLACRISPLALRPAARRHTPDSRKNGGGAEPNPIGPMQDAAGGKVVKLPIDNANVPVDFDI